MSYTTKDYKVGKKNVNEKVKEAELRKEFRSFLDKVGAPVFWCNDEEQIKWMFDTAKHFYKLGLKASDTELEKLIQTLPEWIADERSHQVYLMSLYRFDGQCVVDYVGELEGDSLVCFAGETFMEAATKMREWMGKEPKAG